MENTRLHFAGLPLDIKKCIACFIDRPTDLKNLCLTSQEFRDLAVPILYKTMVLFVGGPQDLRLSAMLSPANPGIKHIRDIYLRLERAVITDKNRHYHSDDSSDEDEVQEDAAIPARQAQFTVRLLLDFLPADQLEIFSWQNWEPFNVDNFLLLCKKQRKLHQLEIGPMDKALDPILEKRPHIFDAMTEVDSIDVYPESIDRLKAAQKLLVAKPKIKNLCVSADFEYAQYSEQLPNDLQDTSTRPGRMARTLFSHMMPFESCKPLVLKDLDLDTIELRYAADTWLKIIKFNTLEKLEIRNCGGADVLFAQLSKPHLRPSRMKSLRWMDDEKSDAYALEAFEGLLESISGLETLDVDTCRMSALPKVLSILHHRKTLTSLSIHSQQDKEQIYYYVEEDFGRLCTECSELRQLSIMFPRTNVEGALPSPEFDNYISNICKLKNLVTLNIRRWPGLASGFSGSLYKVIPTLRLYEHHLQRLSQRIFETSDADAEMKGYGLGHRSNLSVICWGGNGRTWHGPGDKYRLKQIPFVRGIKVDPFGQTSMLAVQTVWRLVQFIEPESDILNHSLYDMLDVHHGVGF